MTKLNISKKKILEEYENNDGYYVISYDPNTLVRLGSYGPLDMHKAFAEVLRRLATGKVKVLCLKYPDDMKTGDRFLIENDYHDAKYYIAKVDLSGRY